MSDKTSEWSSTFFCIPDTASLLISLNLIVPICVYLLEKWNKIITEKELSPAKRQALMGALAKYYSNMLITFIRVTDRKKKDSVKRIKALSHLLDYGMSSRPQTFKKLYNLIGFSGVTALLKIYDKNKRS
jgi:hypothetical protein